MKATNIQSFQIADPETGVAVALLLAAAGYEVETDIHDGTAFVSADGDGAELELLDGDAPQRSAFELACQLRERLERRFDEAELATLRNEFHNVA